MSDKTEFDSLFADLPGLHQAMQDLAAAASAPQPWKVLLVDDEPDVHAALRLVLQGTAFEGRPLQLLHAISAAEARSLLQAHGDIAVILLDVVMETEHAGLDLVRHIRQQLDNQRIQIVIVTGQPGYAPMRKVVTDYAINGYRLKSDMSSDKIFVSVCAALRAFHTQSMLERQHEEMRHMATALLERRASLRALIESAPDAIVMTDAQGRIKGWNPSAERLFGYTHDAMVACSLTQPPASCSDGVQGPALTLLDAAELPQRLGSSHEIEGVRSGGQHFPIEIVLGTWLAQDGHHYSAIIRDISDRKYLEQQIRHQAFHDPLTNLPNRRLLVEQMTHAIAVCARTGAYGALMMLDLDNFKPLNDTHGHDTGDLLLVEFARRMKQCVRNVDTVGRLGGDEFVVLLGELPQERELAAQYAVAVAEKLRAALAVPFVLPVHNAAGAIVEHHCTASIGLTLVDGYSDWGQLLGRVDAAMYAAKEVGRNAVRYIDSTVVR